jgi:D-beta-D-heptose 7-phosphate kinase/D-beta-D-heptose 1-phosphate adenosyltransferase
MNKVVAVSGGFDPLHRGHIEYLKEAKKLGDKLVVILNKDKFLLKEKGSIFMPYEDRREILRSLGFVDDVIPCIDEDNTVNKTLEQLKPDIFAKGSSWKNNNIPEKELCNKLGIKIVFNVGKKIDKNSKALGLGGRK